jgi:phosphopantetheinyl transferase
MGACAAQGHRQYRFALKSAVQLRVERVSALVVEAEAQGLSWLSEEEAARLAAMSSARRRGEFIGGHWLARVVASESTGTRPQDWLLSATASGAPELRWHGTDDRHGMHVSLSHSGDSVAVAIAEFRVGVDLECTARDRDWLALADFTFAPEESEQLRLLPEPDRRDLFFSYWTLKEASGKRDGTGVRLSEAKMQFARECDRSEATAIGWQFDGHCAALAGEQGMQVRARGIPATARQRFWRFEASLSGSMA